MLLNRIWVQDRTPHFLRIESEPRVLNPRWVEARVRIELTHKGFADLSLTTWVPRLQRSQIRTKRNKVLERETGFEPATSTLARSHSTTELFPLLWSHLAH